METSNTLESMAVNEHPTRQFFALPVENQYLLVKSTPLVSRALWREVDGRGGPESKQERVDTLCFYAVLGLLGLIGFDQEHCDRVETLLLPVVFEDDRFAIRLTVHRRAETPRLLILSLPEETIPGPE